ncbi:MAG: hypothetical protein PHQ61_08600, partial [Candidatus Omnitrophica bacterium]|nr:hypothetical protein [Candidatus Omnitrophota bacterium]
GQDKFASITFTKILGSDRQENISFKCPGEQEVVDQTAFFRYNGYKNVVSEVEKGAVYSTREMDGHPLGYNIVRIGQKFGSDGSISIPDGSNILDGAGKLYDGVTERTEKLFEAGKTITAKKSDGAQYIHQVAQTFEKFYNKFGFEAEFSRNGVIETTAQVVVDKNATFRIEGAAMWETAMPDGVGIASVSTYRQVNGEKISTRQDGAIKTVDILGNASGTTPLISVNDAERLGHYFTTTSDPNIPGWMEDNSVTGTLLKSMTYDCIRKGGKEYGFDGGAKIDGGNLVLEYVGKLRYTSTEKDGTIFTCDIGTGYEMPGKKYSPADLVYSSAGGVTAASKTILDTRGVKHTLSYTMDLTTDYRTNLYGLRHFDSFVGDLRHETMMYSSILGDQSLMGAAQLIANKMFDRGTYDKVNYKTISYTNTDKSGDAYKLTSYANKVEGNKTASLSVYTRGAQATAALMGQNWWDLAGLKDDMTSVLKYNGDIMGVTNAMRDICGDHYISSISFPWKTEGGQFQAHEVTQLTSKIIEDYGVDGKSVELNLYDAQDNVRARQYARYDADGALKSQTAYLMGTDSRTISDVTLFGDHTADIHTDGKDLYLVVKGLDSNPLAASIGTHEFSEQYSGDFSGKLIAKLDMNGQLTPVEQGILGTFKAANGALDMKLDGNEISASRMMIGNNGLMQMDAVVTINGNSGGTAIDADVFGYTGPEMAQGNKGEGPVPVQTYRYTYEDGKITNGTIAVKGGVFANVVNLTTIVDEYGYERVYTDIVGTGETGLERGAAYYSTKSAVDHIVRDQVWETLSNMGFKYEHSDVIGEYRTQLEGNLKAGNYVESIATLGKISNQAFGEMFVKKSMEVVADSTGVKDVLRNRALTDLKAAYKNSDGEYKLADDMARKVQTALTAHTGYESEGEFVKSLSNSMQFYQGAVTYMQENLYSKWWYTAAGGELLFEDNYKAEALMAVKVAALVPGLIYAAPATLVSMGLWAGVSVGVDVGVAIYTGQDINTGQLIGNAINSALTAGALKGGLVIFNGLKTAYNVYRGVGTVKGAAQAIRAGEIAANVEKGIEISARTAEAATRGAQIVSFAKAAGLAAGLNTAWYVGSMALDPKSEITASGLMDAALKGAAFGLAVKGLGQMNLFAKISPTLAAGATRMAIAGATMGALNLGYDALANYVRTGTGLSTSQIVNSIGQGVMWGAVAGYLSTPAGMNHLSSIGSRAQEMGITNRQLVAQKGGGLLSALKDPLFLSSAKGAASWAAISPLFTAAEGMWTALATGIEGAIKGNGFLESAKFETANGPVTMEMLIRSAIEGPKQGLWMGPMIHIMGQPSLDGGVAAASAAEEGFLSRVSTNIASGNIGTAAMDIISTSASWTWGNVEMAGFVTGMHKLLDNFTSREGDGGIGISTVGSNMGISELDILSWAALFMKPHQLSLIPLAKLGAKMWSDSRTLASKIGDVVDTKGDARIKAESALLDTLLSPSTRFIGKGQLEKLNSEGITELRRSGDAQGDTMSIKDVVKVRRERYGDRQLAHDYIQVYGENMDALARAEMYVEFSISDMMPTSLKGDVARSGSGNIPSLRALAETALRAQSSGGKISENQVDVITFHMWHLNKKAEIQVKEAIAEGVRSISGKVTFDSEKARFESTDPALKGRVDAANEVIRSFTENTSWDWGNKSFAAKF